MQISEEIQYQDIKLLRVKVDFGHLNHLTHPGYFFLKIIGINTNNKLIKASFLLHITEDINKLKFIQTHKKREQRLINSYKSPAFARKSDYALQSSEDLTFFKKYLHHCEFYQLKPNQIRDYFEAKVKYHHKSTENKRIRSVAFTCHDPGIIGGGNKVLFQWINRFSEFGIQTTLYTNGEKLPYWMQLRCNVRYFHNYREMISSIKEDAVIFFSSTWHLQKAIDFLGTKLYGKPIYHIKQTVEQYNFGFDYDSIYLPKPIVNLLDTLPFGHIYISPHLKNYFSTEPKLYNSYSVYNGVSTQTFFPLNLLSTKQFNFEKEIKFITIGHPTYFLKGSIVVFEALCLLSAEHPQIQFQWTLVSGLNNADIVSWLKNIPANLKIDFQFSLNHAELNTKLNQHDFFINSSLYEGFGLPSLEAMSAGVACLQADNMGLEEIAINEYNCLQFQNNSAVDLKNKIIHLMKNPELHKKILLNGRITAEKNSEMNQHDQIDQMISHLLQRKGLLTMEEKIANNTPLVSVVLPSYNQAQYLPQALQSLIDQTYPHWEAIVVNDGSSDNTVEVLEAYAKKDARIKFISKKNGGITSALNAGIEHASGEYFCWLSTDDYFYPQKLEIQVEAFKKLDSNFVMVYGAFDLLHEKPEGDQLEQLPTPAPILKGTEFAEGFRHDFIDGCTIMIRLSVLKEIGGFNPYYRHAQDFEMWLKLGSLGYFFHLVPEKVSVRRVHPHQSSTGNMIYCRYDAANMIYFYLNNYKLMEVYRYFDLHNPSHLKNFVQHLATRVDHIESNVNNPINFDLFWTWVDEGLQFVNVELQLEVLNQLLAEFKSRQTQCSRFDLLIQKCQHSLKAPRQHKKYPIRFRGPDIRKDNRFDSPFNHQLYLYICKLLADFNVLVFGQELAHHDTYKFVDTKAKLAHSGIRYLTQYANTYQSELKIRSDKAFIPNTQEQAIELLFDIGFPQLKNDLLQSYFEKGTYHNISTEAVVKKDFKLMKSVPEKEFLLLKDLATSKESHSFFKYLYALHLIDFGKKRQASLILRSSLYIQDGQTYRKQIQFAIANLIPLPLRILDKVAFKAKQALKGQSRIKTIYWKLRASL